MQTNLSSINARFGSLGRDVELRWKRKGEKLHLFPEIASQCIKDHRLDKQMGAESLIRWSARARKMPRQFDMSNSFGNPPITVYWSEKFVVDLLFWTHPSTTVHDHGFSGAFSILEGTSMQCLYKFDPQENYKKQVILGRLDLEKVGMLHRGDTQMILSGRQFIHSVWHLPCPTLSMVVRTKKDIPDQYNYYPRLAVNFCREQDAIRNAPLVNKRVAFLTNLCQVDHPQKDQFACELLQSSSPFLAFVYLEKYCRMTPDRRKWGRIFQAARKRHGRWIDPIEDTLCTTSQTMGGEIHWDNVRAEGPRFLLALLSSLKDKKRIHHLVQEEYPGKSVKALITKWALWLSKRQAARLAPASYRTLRSLL